MKLNARQLRQIVESVVNEAPRAPGVSHGSYLEAERLLKDAISEAVDMVGWEVVEMICDSLVEHHSNYAKMVDPFNTPKKGD